MGVFLEFLIGITAAAVGVFTIRIICNRNGINFWAWGLIIAAFVYIGFAAYARHIYGLMHGSLGLLVYGTSALLSRKFGTWLLGLGWLMHIDWDIFHGQFYLNTSYVPDWYPGICAGFDLFIAGYIAFIYFQKKEV